MNVLYIEYGKKYVWVRTYDGKLAKFFKNEVIPTCPNEFAVSEIKAIKSKILELKHWFDTR